VLSAESKEAIRVLCPDVHPDVVDDFFTRMDEDYFATFSADEIASHIRMSARLDSNQRLHVRIQPNSVASSDFDITIVGLDYLSEFSMFCGLLSAFGLDIRAGNIFSFSPGKARRASPRKIVDAFYVTLKSGEAFDKARQQQFVQELHALADLLATGAADEARTRLNRFLTERVEKMKEPLRGLVKPIEIHFDNDASAEWTVMEARSEDAFALLYAISNALAMQGVYIHKVKIRSVGQTAEDQFFLSDRWGQKIQAGSQQDRLSTSVAMIKQFTHFLPEAADPAKAMRHFDQFLDKVRESNLPDSVMTFLAGREGMSLLAYLLGSSDYLWDDFLAIHFRELLPVLERFARGEKLAQVAKPLFQADLQSRLQGARSFDEKKEILNRFKDDQLFLIDVQHLLKPTGTLLEFSRSLTGLAEVVIDEAATICSENLALQARGLFTVCGLGKFGGREMGYASDLELLFVHEVQTPADSVVFESLARSVVEFIEQRIHGIFQIDLRLRPYGDAGAWSIPFDEFERYYSATGPAASFERQALIKLRWIAGDEGLGRKVEAHRDAFTYSGAPWDGETALHLRRRQMRELVKPGQTNVKYSAGGIVDIEYTAQYLQVIHGNEYPEIRVPSSLAALERLRKLKIISEAEYEVLHPAYLFLRNLIDALRIVRGDASDLLLPPRDSEEFKSLARRLGYREHDRTEASRRLSDELEKWMKNVHEVFVRRFEKGS
jgi:glutamate-ammonia-ligase adenylyltransferase